MEISKAIGMGIALFFVLFASICVLILIFSIITAACAIPVYLVSLVLSIKFSWANAAVLAGVLIISYGILSNL